MSDEHPLTARYTNVAIVLHWIVAVLMIANIILGLSIDKIPEDWIRPVIDVHKSIGVTVLGLILMRVLWRLGHRPPPFSAGMALWERIAAHIVHYGLYVLMLWMPITGWLHDSAWKAAPEIPLRWFGLFEFPRIGFIMNQPPETKEYLHGLFGSMHAIAGYVLFWIVLLHVAGALKHQFLDKEPEFRRMWPR
jgi:cytochrome b561